MRPAVHIYITTAVYNIHVHVYTHPSGGEEGERGGAGGVQSFGAFLGGLTRELSLLAAALAERTRVGAYHKPVPMMLNMSQGTRVDAIACGQNGGLKPPES